MKISKIQSRRSRSSTADQATGGTECESLQPTLPSPESSTKTGAKRLKRGTLSTSIRSLSATARDEGKRLLSRVLSKAKTRKSVAVQYDLRQQGGPLVTVEGCKIFLEYKDRNSPEIWHRDENGRWEEWNPKGVITEAAAARLSRAMSAGYGNSGSDRSIHAGTLEMLYKKYLSDVILMGSDDKSQDAKRETLDRRRKRGSVGGANVPREVASDGVNPSPVSGSEGSVHPEPGRDVGEAGREFRNSQAADGSQDSDRP